MKPGIKHLVVGDKGNQLGSMGICIFDLFKFLNCSNKCEEID